MTLRISTGKRVSVSTKQRDAFAFLVQKAGRLFSTDELARATNYTVGTAGTHLSEHWAAVVERAGELWKTRQIFLRMSFDDFLVAISQSKRRGAAGATGAGRRYLLLDASVVVAAYVPSATRSARLQERSRALIDSVRNRSNDSFLYMPNFCIAETFSVFMKHRFGKWNPHVKHALTQKEFRAAVHAFQRDIHNGHLIYQYELSRYHVLGINLVAPVDHHYQMARPMRKKPRDRRTPKPAGTFDQLIVSMGVQLAHLHGAVNTVVVTADARLAGLIDQCRRPMKPGTQKTLGVDGGETIVGRRFEPSTFPNVLDLQRAPKRQASEFAGCVFPR